jgi:anti-sigma factor RsiW
VADAWLAKLDTYLDGELPSDEMRAADAHVRSCPTCAAAVLNRVQMKRAVQGAGKRYEPRAEFRAQIAKMVGGKTAAQKASAGFRWSWVALGAMAMVLAFGAAWTYRARQTQQTAQVFGELADLHVATLASANPIDVVSTDRHTVKPWFQGRIPFTFSLPELAGSDFTLVGGRVTYLHQSPGAQLIYQVRKHEISVFIFQDRVGERWLETSSPVANRMSFNMESWTAGGLRYFVVGDAGAEDIARLSEMLRKVS